MMLVINVQARHIKLDTTMSETQSSLFKAYSREIKEPENFTTVFQTVNKQIIKQKI